MDPLSDVFMAMRVTTSACVRLEFSAPWGFCFDGYQHAHFGVVTRGRCWLSLNENPRAQCLSKGDCWLLPRGDTHSLRDHPKRDVRPYREIQKRKIGGVVRNRGEGEGTTIIVGNFTFDAQSSRWLTDLLPQLITFRMDQGKSSAMQSILEILSLESQTDTLGSAIVMSRLADILFVQAIRAYSVQTENLEAGWLRAVGDPRMSVALRAMHEATEKRWTVAALALTAGMSRSNFATQFKQLLGESPLQYLTRWRMHKATRLLREKNAKLARVAGLVGYESDGAFNRVFKRTVGIPPGAYRRSFA